MGGWYDHVTPTTFWLAASAFAGAGGVILLVIARPLRAWMGADADTGELLGLVVVGTLHQQRQLVGGEAEGAVLRAQAAVHVLGQQGGDFLGVGVADALLQRVEAVDVQQHGGAHALAVRRDGLGQRLRQRAAAVESGLRGGRRALAALGADQQLDHALAVLGAEDQLRPHLHRALAPGQHHVERLAVVLALLHRAQAFLDLHLLVRRHQVDQRLAGQFRRVVGAEQVGEGLVGVGDDAFLHVRHRVGGVGGELLVARLEVGQALLRQAQVAHVVVLDELAHHHQFKVPQLAQVFVGGEILRAGGQRRHGVLDRVAVADHHHRQVRPQPRAQLDHRRGRRGLQLLVGQHQVGRVALHHVLQVFEVVDPGHPQRMAGVAQVAFDALGDFLGRGHDQQHPRGLAQQCGGEFGHRFARHHGSSVLAGCPDCSRARRGTR